MTTPGLDGDFVYPPDDVSNINWNSDDYIQATWEITSADVGNCSLSLWVADWDDQDTQDWVGSRPCDCTGNQTWGLDVYPSTYVGQFVVTYSNTSDEDGGGELDSNLFVVHPMSGSSGGDESKTWGPDTIAQPTGQAAGATGTSAPTSLTKPTDSHSPTGLSQDTGNEVTGSSAPSGGAIAGAVIGSMLGTLLVCFLAFFFWRRRVKQREKSMPPMPYAWHQAPQDGGYGIQTDYSALEAKKPSMRAGRAELGENASLTSELPDYNGRPPSELPPDRR